MSEQQPHARETEPMADEVASATEVAQDADDKEVQADNAHVEEANIEESQPQAQNTDALVTEATDSGTVATDVDDGGAEEPLVHEGMNWFVLRVASNKENSVRETLLRKIKIEGFEHLVNRILVPTEKHKTIKAGKQRITQKLLYPGYVFVEMKLEDDGRIPQDVFFLIKETTGVGDFIGTAGRPAPMEHHEIEKMLAASKAPEESPQVKMEYQKGDHIKIKEGAFENMEGTVDELLPDQGKVRVIVTIFGRATPLEIEYWQIERVEE